MTKIAQRGARLPSASRPKELGDSSLFHNLAKSPVERTKGTLVRFMTLHESRIHISSNPKEFVCFIPQNSRTKSDFIFRGSSLSNKNEGHVEVFIAFPGAARVSIAAVTFFFFLPETVGIQRMEIIIKPVSMWS